MQTVVTPWKDDQVTFGCFCASLTFRHHCTFPNHFFLSPPPSLPGELEVTPSEGQSKICARQSVPQGCSWGPFQGNIHSEAASPGHGELVSVQGRWGRVEKGLSEEHLWEKRAQTRHGRRGGCSLSFGDKRWFEPTSPPLTLTTTLHCFASLPVVPGGASGLTCIRDFLRRGTPNTACF